MPNPDKAKIYVFNRNGEKLNDKTIEVMFNPSEYTNTINVKWKGKEGKIPQFDGSNFGSLTIPLLFSTYEYGKDVREDNEVETGGAKRTIHGTKRIAELSLPTDSGKQSKDPPTILFSWGKFNFKGKIEKVDQKFTIFLPDGTPARATVTITIKPVDNVKEILKMQGVEACRKVRIVKEGDRLDIIAADELKDPHSWKKIAEANDIVDPLKFPGPEDIGRVLIIPDQEF